MSVLELLPALACGGGMALAMWLVTRPSARSGTDAHGRRIEELEAEIARLRAAQPDPVTPPSAVASGHRHRHRGQPAR